MTYGSGLTEQQPSRCDDIKIVTRQAGVLEFGRGRDQVDATRYHQRAAPISREPARPARTTGAGGGGTDRSLAPPHLTSHPRRTQPQAICQGTSKAAGSRNLISPAKHGAQTPDPTTTGNSQWPDPDRRELRGEAARRKGEGHARTHLVRLRSAARVRGSGSGSGGSRSDGNVAVEALVSGGVGSGSVDQGWGGGGRLECAGGGGGKESGQKGVEKKRKRIVLGVRDGWEVAAPARGGGRNALVLPCHRPPGLLARQVSPLTLTLTRRCCRAATGIFFFGRALGARTMYLVNSETLSMLLFTVPKSDSPF
ncbi:unnamed protein product [Miscanthus lutarioriparius]|uniref:Uncharacterized protein n=1 Tax=Miscanthus lutarioriparius TaxID=422564 RepID=A0A811P1Z2_9POAL|nr:unnamed protein product [Miscanthus lutarioriparius]